MSWGLINKSIYWKFIHNCSCSSFDHTFYKEKNSLKYNGSLQKIKRAKLGTFAKPHLGWYFSKFRSVWLEREEGWSDYSLERRFVDEKYKWNNLLCENGYQCHVYVATHNNGLFKFCLFVYFMLWVLRLWMLWLKEEDYWFFLDNSLFKTLWRQWASIKNKIGLDILFNLTVRD